MKNLPKNASAKTVVWGELLMIGKYNKTCVVLSLIFGFAASCLPEESVAKVISTKEIYGYAQKNDINSLKVVQNIDITDKYGNTAYCLALKDKNETAAKLLEKQGADTKHKCTAGVGVANKRFWGMSKTGWGWLGALAGGGAIVAASGSSGGSGGGIPSDTNNNRNDEPEKPVVLNCQHGVQQDKACV